MISRPVAFPVQRAGDCPCSNPLNSGSHLTGPDNSMTAPIILVTAWSFLIWRFSHRGISREDSARYLLILTVVFLVGAANILWLGIYGYYIPANVRVGLSVPMAATTFTGS